MEPKCVKRCAQSFPVNNDGGRGRLKTGIVSLQLVRVGDDVVLRGDDAVSLPLPTPAICAYRHVLGARVDATPGRRERL